MGTKQSKTVRRVQPSLPFLTPYARLSPSSSSSVNQSLLDKIDDDLDGNYYSPMAKGKLMEEQGTAIQTLRERNAALEREVDELRRRIDGLESTPPKVSLMEEHANAIEKLQKRNAALERQVDELRRKVATNESIPSKGPIEQGTDLETVHEQIANILHTVNGLKSAVQNVELMSLNDPCMHEGPEIQDEESNLSYVDDLIGGLVILIFLISILIGLHL